HSPFAPALSHRGDRRPASRFGGLGVEWLLPWIGKMLFVPILISSIQNAYKILARTENYFSQRKTQYRQYRYQAGDCGNNTLSHQARPDTADLARNTRPSMDSS